MPYCVFAERPVDRQPPLEYRIFVVSFNGFGVSHSCLPMCGVFLATMHEQDQFVLDCGFPTQVKTDQGVVTKAFLVCSAHVFSCFCANYVGKSTIFCKSKRRLRDNQMSLTELSRS